MDLEWSEGHLERFYNLRENYSEHFDEERAKEIAKWLKDHQEEVYLDKLLEEGLSHEEAWEIASKTTSSGVSIEELTEAQLKRYQELREEFFSEADALDIVVLFTDEQKQRYLELLENAFGPDDAWGMASNYEPDEEDDDEQSIPDGYSGEGFLETLEEIKYELNNAIATRSLCRRYGRNGKEKQEQLIEYDRRIDRLEHLLKNFENTVSTEVEA
jgi:arsenate reductase-like glutaredoxin family protein